MNCERGFPDLLSCRQSYTNFLKLLQNKAIMLGDTHLEYKHPGSGSDFTYLAALLPYSPSGPEPHTQRAALCFANDFEK